MEGKSLYLVVLLCSVVAALSTGTRGRTGSASCHKVLPVSNSEQINHSVASGNGLLCNYAFEANATKQIKLNFTATDLAASYYLLDYVLVFDGPDCLSMRLGVAHQEITPVFVSSGNKMTALLIKYQDQGSFSATYSAVSAQKAAIPKTAPQGNRILIKCGEEIVGERGNISFRGDGRYNALCIWRLRVKQGMRVHLTLTEVQLKLINSWVRILDGDDCAANEMSFITGRDISLPYVTNSTSNVMTVMFSSGSGSPDESIEGFYSDGESTTSSLMTTTRPTATEVSGRRVTEVPEYVNSLATKHTYNVLSAVLVHSAYYAYWITMT